MIATLTRAPVAACSIATAVIAATILNEQGRSVAHLMGNRGTQHAGPHDDSAGSHSQEHGVFH